MAAFLFKVFTLTLRTAAKPLANRFQAFVLSHPTLRPRVVKLAQVGPCFRPAHSQVGIPCALTPLATT